MRFNRVIYELSIGIVGRLRPDRESEPAAGFQDTARFRAGSFRVGQMEQGKVCQDAIKGPVREGKILRIAFPKLDLWKHLFRDRNHLLGEIQSDWHCAALCRRRRYITRSSAYI